MSGEYYGGEPAEDSQWQYVAVVDERTCLGCMQYDGMIFSWADVKALFPNAQQINDFTCDVNQHPNCRCQLVMISSGGEEGVEEEAEVEEEAVKEGAPAEEAEAGFLYWSGRARYEGRRALMPLLRRLGGELTRGRVTVPGTGGEEAITVTAPSLAELRGEAMMTRMMLSGARMAARLIPEELSAVLPMLGWAGFAVNMLIPIIQLIIRQYVEAEVRRKLEEYEKKRGELYREAYRSVAGDW